MIDMIMYLPKWTTVMEPDLFTDGTADESVEMHAVQYAPGYVDVSVYPQLKPFCIQERPR